MTPGPWEYEEVRNVVTGIDDGGCKVLKAVPYGGTPEEVKANGQFIAAVRDLLEACKAAYSVLKHSSNERGFIAGSARLEMLKDVTAQCRAAIAKAEGEGKGGKRQ